MLINENRKIVLNYDEKCIDVYDKTATTEWNETLSWNQEFKWVKVGSIVKQGYEGFWFPINVNNTIKARLASFWDSIKNNMVDNDAEPDEKTQREYDRLSEEDILFDNVRDQ